MKKYLLAITALICGLTAFSQSGFDVSGNVKDAENGETLPGVTLLVKGSGTKGTITDFDGNFQLTDLSESDVLIVSFVGFKSQEVLVGSNTVIDINLRLDIEQLEEVVVIGYGTQKKKVVTGAIESISAEEISSTAVTRVEQALQGRAAGVQVQSQSGQPGEQPSIKIRGIGTDYNSEPLYLVDGVAVNSIDNLNPGDIESLEVLKDAASSSIYGARAANGVVLITTKSGGDGKTSISYSGYRGVQNVAKKVDLLNAEQYVQLMADAGLSNNAGELFDPNEVQAYDTDWQKELFTENAPIESHQISVTGGNEKSSFASSISYFNQEGIVGGAKSKFERYTARLNSRHEITSWLNWGNTISYANIVTKGVTSNGSFNGEYSSALNMDPITGIYEDDQNLLETDQQRYGTNPYVVDENGRAFAISNNVRGEVVNPLARLSLLNQVVTKDQVLGNLFAELEPIKGLKFKSSYGVDFSYLEIDRHNNLNFLNSTTNNVVATNMFKEYQHNLALQQEQVLTYERSISGHKINVLAGASTLTTRWENLTGGGQGIDTSNPDLIFLDLTIDSTDASGGTANETLRASLFSRILYDYEDRISFSATYRRDGSSNFGANNRYGNFWSFGASWVLNEEAFFPDVPYLSFLKLRASWGQNGNDRIRSFVFASTVDFNVAYNLANGVNNGSIPDKVANEDVKWETSEQLDIGLETGFFDDRLTATFDYYKKTTNDLLQVRDLNSILGFPSTFSNVGTMENEGFEISAQWRNSGDKLNYSIGFNAAYNKNTMVEVANEAGFISGADWALAGEVTRTIEGEPVTSFFGYKTDGIFQSEADVFAHINGEGNPIQPDAEPGDIRYVDTDGDGIISDADRTAIGSPIPDWTFGSTISLDYMNFDFSTLLIGQTGNEIFNGINRPDIQTTNKQTWILDRWTAENPSNDIPRFVAGDPNENYTNATDMVNIENGSFLRIRNIQIGYNIPKSLLDKFKCSAWRVYISGENLITFTKYSGPDPEVGAPVDFEGSGVSSIRDMGIDRGIYPQARTFRIGTSVTF